MDAFFAAFGTGIHMAGTFLGGWPTDRWGARLVLVFSTLLTVYGIWQRDDVSGEVRHIVAKRLVDMTPLLGDLSTISRDFH